mgnify:CR=1 FL=1
MAYECKKRGMNLRLTRDVDLYWRVGYSSANPTCLEDGGIGGYGLPEDVKRQFNVLKSRHYFEISSEELEKIERFPSRNKKSIEEFLKEFT